VGGLDALAGEQGMHAVLERRAHPRQHDPVAEQITQVTQLARGDVRLRQQIGAQQMGERARVDRVCLHACRGDCLRAQRVREVQLMSLLFEQVGEPFPAVGRLERDLQLAAQLGEDRLQRVTDIHHDPYYSIVLPALARAALQIGDPDLVARLADNIPETLPIQHNALATARALQAEASGNHNRAAHLHGDAASRWQRFGDVLEQAHALLGEGRCLSQLGDPAADQPLRQARALFTEMGARPRVAECDTLIAQAVKLSS
jgi:hypothetical protein